MTLPDLLPWGLLGLAFLVRPPRLRSYLRITAVAYLAGTWALWGVAWLAGEPEGTRYAWSLVGGAMGLAWGLLGAVIVNWRGRPR
jgi:hypothetical protein